ncbi:MAG: alpha/beta hydrolase [Bacteriovoracaceae bacterium]|nr:alpha/beta hydrolase [Bacteriovoracaceae bacterium]
MKKYLPKILSILSYLLPQLAAKIALNIFATPTRIPRPISEMKAFEASKKFFLKNNIAAFQWGEDHHPTVLLIHGWNGRGTQISAFYQQLVAKNFRVIALDGPGHGDSPGKKTNPGHYAQFIIDAQREIAPEGIHSLIAHSFGGGCAVLAASRGLKTKSLVLVASPAFYDRVVEFFSNSLGLKAKSKIHFYKLVGQIAGIDPRELNIGNLGKTLNIPALVVHDEDDNAVNFLSATSIIELWPGTLLLKTKGLGHRRILKDPQVITEVCDFIEKN